MTPGDPALALPDTAPDAAAVPDYVQALERAAYYLDDAQRAQLRRAQTQTHRSYIAAEEIRARLNLEWARFFESYDVLALPTSQVPPFPADQEYPTEIDGRPTQTYLDWMRSAYLITVTGCPAISLPAGITPEGLPVGIQVVAPHGADRFLLEVAAAFEEATR